MSVIFENQNDGSQILLGSLYEYLAAVEDLAAEANTPTQELPPGGMMPDSIGTTTAAACGSLSVVRCISAEEMQFAYAGSHGPRIQWADQWVVNNGGEILHINVDDAPDVDLASRLREAADFIKYRFNANASVYTVGTTADGGRCSTSRSVFVHCQMGISRSSCVMAGYMMIHRDVKLKAALQFLQGKRSQVRPNNGFLKQLVQLNMQLFGEDVLNEQSSDDGEVISRPTATDIDTILNARVTDLISTLFRSRDYQKYDRFFRQEENGGVAPGDDSGPDVLWCPPPVQVGIDEFFQLSNLDTEHIRESSFTAGHSSVSGDPNSLDVDNLPCIKRGMRMRSTSPSMSCSGNASPSHHFDPQGEAMARAIAVYTQQIAAVEDEVLRGAQAVPDPADLHFGDEDDDTFLAQHAGD